MLSNASGNTKQIYEAHRVDGAESGQVVFVGSKVPMPGNHIKWGELLLRLEHSPAQLVHHCEGALPVLKSRHWRLKVSRSRQTICTYMHT